VKAVFIDMGETLVRFKPRFHESIAKAISEEGFEVDERKVFRALMKVLGKCNFPHYDGLSQVNFRELFYHMGLYVPSEVVKKLERKNYLAEEYELYEDAIPFLEEVRKKGYKAVLVTNTTKKVNQIVRDLNLMEHLDGIVASCDYNVMKPHPKIFHYATRVARGEGVHIGDVYEIDVLGAKRAYLPGILLDRLDYYPEIKENRARNLFEALSLIEKLDG
jgi:2-haloacid dehalogenase/putative hydrolase of the HAD superfamily